MYVKKVELVKYHTGKEASTGVIQRTLAITTALLPKILL